MTEARVLGCIEGMATASVDGKDVPKGISAVFLTGASAEGFGLHECTLDDPYRFLSKQVIIDEIKFKGAISDMYVLKKDVEKYKGEEIMVHLDDDEVFGQNFFVVFNPDLTAPFVAAQEAHAAEMSKKKKKKPEGEAAAGGEAGAEEEEDDYEEEEYVPPVSKPWESLGSEAEITEEACTDTRPRYVMALTCKRKEFNKAHKFSDRDSSEDPNITMNDCRPYKDPNFETRRKEHHVGIQAVPELTESKCQTTWFRPVAKAIQYAPIGLSEREKYEAMDSDAMRDFLTTIRERYEEALQQNETVDIYSDDFADLAEDEGALGNKTDSELKELQSYYHLQYCAGRLLTHIQWQPGAKGVVAVAGARRMTFEERVGIAGKVHTGYILLWSSLDPIQPQMVLEAPGDVHCFKFCPTNSDLVIGGLESGQIAMWDLADARAKAREAKMLSDDTGEEGGSNTITASPTILSAVDLSHKRSVTDLIFLPANFEVSERGKFTRPKDPPTEQNMFLSVGADGTLLWWDVRKAHEAPEEKPDDKGKKKPEGWGPHAKMAISNPDGAMELSPVYAYLDVDEDVTGPASVYTVTEEGEFTTIHLSNPQIENFSKGVRSVIPGHYGPCVALQRSPFVAGVHLSVGDWTFNIWREGITSPLFSSPFCSTSYTCGAWSPSRPAVLFIGRSDGMVDIWDLLDRSHEPSMTVAVTPAEVTSMEFQVSTTRQLLAVGDDQGTVHVMEVPRNLRRAAANEKTFAANFFSREEKRVEYVQRRSAEIKESGGGGGGGEEKKEAPAEVKEGEATEEEKAEAAFLAMEEKFLLDMGLLLDEDGNPIVKDD